MSGDQMHGCRSVDEVLAEWPDATVEDALLASDMSCRAAAIDATYSGTPSGSTSDWQLGKSPSDYDR